jgi:hypothetical protein
MRVRYCQLCGLKMNRFYLADEKREIWKCPAPEHRERVKKQKRHLLRLARKKKK